MRSRVTENCWPTSSSVWSVFMPMPKRMRTMRSSRGVAEHREDVLDLLGIDLFHQGVDLVMGDVATLLGGADQRLHGRVRPVEQGAVRRGLGTLLLQHLFLLRVAL